MDTCRVILCNLESVWWIFLPFTASYPLNEPSDSPVMLFESQIYEFVSANSQSCLVQSRGVFLLTVNVFQLWDCEKSNNTGEIGYNFSDSGIENRNKYSTDPLLGSAHRCRYSSVCFTVRWCLAINNSKTYAARGRIARKLAADGCSSGILLLKSPNSPKAGKMKVIRWDRLVFDNVIPPEAKPFPKSPAKNQENSARPFVSIWPNHKGGWVECAPDFP